jgi:hypothetical protein
MSGPWEDYEDKTPGAESGPWADYADPAPKPKKDVKGINPNDNQWGPEMDMLGNALEGFSDGARYAVTKVPVLGPLAASIGAGTQALFTDKTYEEGMQEVRDREAFLEKRSPVATTISGIGANIAGFMASPFSSLNAAKGVAGAAADVGAGLLTSGADMIARDQLMGQEENNAGLKLAGEAGINLLTRGAGKAISALGDADALKGKAVKNVKDMFNPTIKEQQAFGIKSDDLDNAARRFLDDGNLNNPFVTKNTLYEKAAGSAQQKFQQFDDILNTKARTPTQAELYEHLATQKGAARNTLNPELADQLSREAGAVKSVDSVKLPGMGSADDIKALEMQATDLDPNLIRQRRSSLDMDSRDAFGAVSDRAKAEAAHSYRNFEEGLLQPDDLVAYKGKKGEYGDAALARDLLAKQAARGETQTLMGAVDRNFGSITGGNVGQAVAGTPGRVVGQLTGGGAFSAIKSYGPQFKAWGYNLGAKVAENNKWMQTLAKAGERGGQAGVASAHYLMMQRDPEYRKAYTTDTNKEKEQ